VRGWNFMENFDFGKLKEEDRRFLLNRSLSNLISNEQGRAGNTSLIISAVAVLGAMFSLVLQVGNLIYYLIYGIFSLSSMIIMIKKYRLANKKISEENNSLRKQFNALFSMHFNYAQK
jgi:hypothetical protein